MTQLLNGIAPLSHLGVIRVEGEDAAKFLHGQLTQDFALLDMQHARLAAFLSAKGRMQASFIGFKRSATEVLLVCSLDLLAPTLKRLSMFVLRAKAKLSDATADFALYGLKDCCGFKPLRLVIVNKFSTPAFNVTPESPHPLTIFLGRV